MLNSLLQLASASSLQGGSHSLAQSSHSMLQAADSMSHHFTVQRFGDYQPNYDGANTTLYVLAIVAIVLGAAVMLLTIAFRRSHMFVAMTFMGWGVSYYLISRYLPNLSTETVMWSSALAGLGFGLLGAELTIGTFLCGVSAGVVVWWVIFSADPTIFISPNDLKYSYVLFVPLGLGMGVIALALGNLGIVFSTPFIGSFMIVQGLNYFYNANLQALYVLDRELGSCLPNNCYYYLGLGIGGGVLLGWIVQAALLRRLVYIANEGEVVEQRGLFRRTRKTKAAPAAYAGNNRNAAYEETVIDNNRGGYAPNQYGDSYGQTPSNRYNGGGYSDDYPTLNVNNQRGNSYRQPAYYA